MPEHTAFFYEVLRVLFASVSGILGCALFITALRVWNDPDFATKRHIARAIKRYHRGEISEEQLKAVCPDGSLKFGFVIETRRDGSHKIVPKASINGTF